MYLFGILVYIALPLASATFDSSAEFMANTFALAPEIAYMITVAYFYPLVIFFLGMLLKKTKVATLKYFDSQSILASTLAVSFGLIGTFIGLAEMIGGIAAGMGAEGDFATKMNSLLTAISSALDSMSFAFLTSILGIGASSSILFCSNFMFSYYKDEDEKAKEEELEEPGFKSSDVVTRIEESIQESLDLIAKKEEVWSDLFLLLEKNTGSKVVEDLNQTLEKNNNVGMIMTSEMKGMRKDHGDLFTANNVNLEKQTEQVTAEMQNMREDYVRLFSESNSNAVTQAGHVTDEMKTMRSDYAGLLAENNTNAAEHAAKVVTEVQGLRQEHAELVAESNSQMSRHSEHVSSAVLSSSEGLANMGYAVDEMRKDSSSNTDAITHVISDNVNKLEGVSNLLDEFSVALAPPLHEALEKAITDNVLKLNFQAQKGVKGEFVGAETFVFWEDSIRGKISNLELFKQAEKHDLLEPLDAWIIESTFEGLAEWVKDGVWNNEATLSINVSNAYFVSPTFIADLERLLVKYAVTPSFVALEITEDTLMTYPELCQDKIRQIRNLGIKLYIDDFGSGYTSMKNLRTLNIDMLKIDRTIVRDILDSNEGESVVRSIVSMASELGINVAAEGVESQEQIDKLTDLGCSIFQGYYIGRPAGTDEFHAQHVLEKK